MGRPIVSTVSTWLNTYGRSPSAEKKVTRYCAVSGAPTGRVPARLGNAGSGRPGPSACATTVSRMRRNPSGVASGDGVATMTLSSNVTR
jgi:hypothetical protein